MGFLGCWGARPSEFESIAELKEKAAAVYQIDGGDAERMAEAIEKLGRRERKVRAIRNFPAVFGFVAHSGKSVGYQPSGRPKTEQPGQLLLKAFAAEIGVDAGLLRLALQGLVAKADSATRAGR